MTFGKCYLVFIALGEDCIFSMNIFQYEYFFVFFSKTVLLDVGYVKC